MLPTPCGSDDLSLQTARFSELFQGSADSNIFHQGNLRETAHGLKSLAAHEDGLITGGYTGQAGARIHHAGNQLENSLPAIELHIKTAPFRALLHGQHNQFDSPFGQPGVGMQKQQHLRLRMSRTQIHLSGPAALTMQNLID